MPANQSDRERIVELEASLEECKTTITTLKKELEEERARVKDLTKDLNKERKQRLEAVLVQGPGSPVGGIPLLVPGGRPRTKTAPAVPTTVPDSLCLQEILDLVLRPINDIEGWCILHEVCSVLIELHSANKVHGSVSMKSIRLDRSTKIWAVQDYTGVPELPKGEQVTIRADIYCLGATVWNAADYLLDFDEETGLAPEICGLIEKMTSEVPSERPTAEEIKSAAAQYAIQSRYVFNALLQEVDRKKNFRKDIDKEFAEKHKNVYSAVLTQVLIGVKLKPVVPRSDNKPKIDKKEHAELLLLRRSSSRLLKSRLSGNVPILLNKEKELAPKLPKAEIPNKEIVRDPIDKKGKDAIGDLRKDPIREPPKVDLNDKKGPVIPIKETPIRDSINKEANRDATSKEITRDLNRDTYKEKETNKEINREITRETAAREVTREMSKDNNRDTTKEPKERGEERTKDTRRDSRDSPRERERDTKKESRDSPRERERERESKRDSRESPRDNMYRESTFNSAKDATREREREAKRDSREITRDMYRDLNRDINREITRDTNKEIGRGITRDTNREIASPTREITNRDLASPTRELASREITRDANRESSREPNREITRETTKYLNREDEKSRKERHKDKHREKKEEKERRKEGEKKSHRHRDKHNPGVIMHDNLFFHHFPSSPSSSSSSSLSPPFRSLSPPLSSTPVSTPLITIDSPSTRAKRALSQPSPSRKI